MDIQERLKIIKRNTEEITTEEELIELLKTKKVPSVYLGTAVTGRPHVAYFLWVLKLADFLKAGFKVKLLLADLHGALDNTPWELLEKRYEYYSQVIPAMFSAIGADLKNFEIVRGSTFQKNGKYFYDVLWMSTLASVHDCKKAGSEVVKQNDNPKLAGLIYPIMQALDEEYLDVDVQYGGVDQRKILMFAREYLPKLNYRRRVEVMTPIIPGLIGEKMSASNEDSKIDLLDDEKTIQKKLNKAYCPEGIVDANGVLSFIKYVLMTIKKDNGQEFLIERPEKWGGNLSYKRYEELEKDFIEKKVHPMDVKQALAKEISTLLEPIRKVMKGKERLIKEAYP
ncbi:MAG: tyrosine--tRNA ligase [Nanoarchaeota archaeon]|nr:tyrosine--tRNA ligase [Nanoarchaeota archaeon]MBU1704596.1 tyrosine--tRNA ligase [Nanoarchaeota archaeon]